jgi:hypothetical protein
MVMSLTLEGYRERKWGPYPALRQVLENKQLEDRCITSADDTSFDILHRLLEIASLTRQHKEEIIAGSKTIGVENFDNDLAHLESSLESAKDGIVRMIDDVRYARRSILGIS